MWMFLARLPLTPNGKLDRKALPKSDASLLQKRYVAPVGEKADYVTRAMVAVRPFLAEENLARTA